jgi:hypothetical protein
MATKKKKSDIILDQVEEIGKVDTVIVFRARKNLTEEQHKQLSKKLQYEQEGHFGLKIVLAPNSVELSE